CALPILIAGDEAPGAAVPAVVAIVAHAEEVALGNLPRRVVVLLEVAPLRVAVNLIRLGERPPIDVDLAVAHFDGLSRKADDPLDVILFRLLGILEDDDIATLNLAH